MSQFLNYVAIVGMSVALFNIAQEKIQDDGIIRIEVDAEKDRKIKYRIQKINARLSKFIQKNKSAFFQSDSIRKELLKKAVECEYDSVQPDYLAAYMLRFRFVRTKRDVDHRLSWIKDKGGDLLSLLELLDDTQVSDREDEMCDLAHSLANCLGD